MARPQKKGLDYFSFDVGFFQDIKIRKLIKYHGIQAVPVYEILLCRIYEQGYYLEWDVNLPFIISETSYLEEDYITRVIDFMLEVGLFDKDTYESCQVLTSRSIQERYMCACNLTKRKISASLPYLLLDLSADSSETSKTVVSSEQTLFSSEETLINSEETKENSEKSAQRKEKERKDNNSLRSSLSPSSSSSPSAHVREDVLGLIEGEGDEDPISVIDAVKLLKGDGLWLDQMKRRHGISVGILLKWLDAFVIDCDCRGKIQHKDLSDVKQHFNDWLAKQKKLASKDTRKASVSHKITPQQRWSLCFEELFRCVTEEEDRKVLSLVKFESYTPETNIVLLDVPSHEICDIIEARFASLMSVVLSKYFGSFLLKYRILPPSTGHEEKQSE